jgi:hypothetical protein
VRLARLLVVFAAIAVLCPAAWADGPAPLPFVKGSWTLVLLPDTQRYSQSYPENFRNQTQWIVDNKESRNIAFVLHEGDICNANDPAQWKNAQEAISILDGRVPYALVPGNHDYSGLLERNTLMSEYFPVDKLSKDPTFGGVYERGRIENSYHLFSAGGRDWVVVALETFPRDGAVMWADKVLKKYANRSGIIVTHAYLYNDNTRYDYKTRTDQKWSPHGGSKRGGGNDGEEIWQKIVSPNANMAFVFNGHVLGDGAGRLTSIGAKGQMVHQILLNCQSYPNGGSGYLGLVEFLPDGKTVQFKTYSTTMNKYMTDDDHQFTLEMPPAPKAVEGK